MMSTAARRPAWVAPTVLVAVFAVVYPAVRVAVQDSEQPPFPTQRVPAPSTSPTSTPIRADDGLELTASGLGPHHFGDAEGTVVEALTAVLGTPTEDAPEECAAGQPARWVRWADLSIRIDSGRFVAYVEGIHYPPGPPPLAISTREGLVPGDPATRLFELYDRATLNEVPAPGPSEQEATLYEITNGSQPLVVVVEGTPESGRVAAISAGRFCPIPG
jgi:hypothetical protein